MANQIIVTQNGNVQVSIEPTPNVQVQISRAAITTLTDVPTANFANFAGNVTGANQPNITNIGTLTNLAVSGNTTLNNVVVTGNLSVGNLIANSANYANFAGIANSANSVTLANVSGAGNIASINLDGNVANLLTGNGTFVAIPTVSANANFANFAGTAFNVSGSNVTGAVANATFANSANTANSATVANSANSVAVANVSGIGNIATINLDGNASNILYGNGVFATTPVISNVANANYANFSGTAFSVSGSNVSGAVANATYADNAGNANIANSATVANSANSVAVANVSGIGNIATVNLDGSSSNVLFGNGVFAPESTSIANANYANFAGTAFNVSGSNVSGEVANAAYANAANTANLATFATTANAVAGANVSGEVANANFASYANIAASANSVALANVVGIGNIANINLDGSSSNVLFGNGVFAPESTSIANANYANFAGNLINGTSNVSIPVANGTIAVSVNNVANLVMFENGGFVNAFPTSSVVNMLRINTFNNSLSDAHRVAWARARGTNASPTSVQANDRLGILSFFGHNGTSYQTNSIGFIRATVDASYTTNGANIPIGMQVLVNDTNGGINNQARTHNFWANGNVSLNRVIFADGGGLSNIAVANITGIGNIATLNLDGNASNVLFGNGVFSGIPSTTASIIANGTSNVSIPVSNGNVNISANGVANIVSVQASGTTFFTPPTTTVGALTVDSFGNPLGDVHRINSRRARGNATTPLSVNPGDATMRLLSWGHNGTAYQTNSTGSIRAVVDSSYTANGANIPMGWQILVNDTNGGINNQTKIHNFHSNSAVTIGGNLSANGGNYNFSNASSGATVLNIFGDKTTNSVFGMSDAQFSVTMSNVNTTTGFSPFRFQQYAPTSNQFGPMYFFRARGTDFGNSAPVVANDQIMSLNFLVNSNNATSSIGQFNATVTSNDNAGNVGMKLDLNATGTGTTGYLDGVINLLANRTTANNFSASGNITSGSGANLITLDSTNGYITYKRVYGQWQYNTTVTPVAANTAYVFPIGTQDFASVATVGSTSRIIPGKAGLFNLQFSVQVNNADNGSEHFAYIWLRKNGSDVAGSMGRVGVVKNGDNIASWNYFVDPGNTTDYFEIAYAVDNTQITFPSYASTAFGPATATIITTITPVGA